MKPIQVGIVGCGNISDIYLKNLKERFPWIKIAACSDIIPSKARKKASELRVPKCCSTRELLNDESIDIVLNLTTPAFHTAINQAVLKAGKHVYCEKPLALTRKDSARTLVLAKNKRLRVGCAPDTFLGAGIQECRRIIDQGKIGKVVSAQAFMVSHGTESWHPDPEFFYQFGGGPMLDMGPYYLTALVNCIGPIHKISGLVGSAFKYRTITSKNKYGKKIRVETPTHLTGNILFKNGAIGSIVTSFDVWQSTLPRIEIHGTKGSILVPDPNTFGGPVRLFLAGKKDWKEISVKSRCYVSNSRGIGLADMALAILKKRKHRASGELAAHVLDAMLSFEESSKSCKTRVLSTQCRIPQSLPAKMRAKKDW